MDLIVVLVLMVIVIMVYRDVKFLVYLLGIMEVFFKLVHYIGDNLTIVKINPFINKYIPTSIFDVFSEYTTGVVYDVISWVLVIGFCAFLYYLVEYVIRKK